MLVLGQLEEEPPPATVVFGEDTLLIGAGGARLGVERAGRARLEHLRAVCWSYVYVDFLS